MRHVISTGAPALQEVLRGEDGARRDGRAQRPRAAAAAGGRSQSSHHITSHPIGRDPPVLLSARRARAEEISIARGIGRATTSGVGESRGSRLESDARRAPTASAQSSVETTRRLCSDASHLFRRAPPPDCCRRPSPRARSASSCCTARCARTSCSTTCRTARSATWSRCSSRARARSASSSPRVEMAVCVRRIRIGSLYHDTVTNRRTIVWDWLRGRRPADPGRRPRQLHVPHRVGPGMAAANRPEGGSHRSTSLSRALVGLEHANAAVQDSRAVPRRLF